MGSKMKPQMDDLVGSIGELAKARDQLAHAAYHVMVKGMPQL
jgi:hypothetical protein